jgi:hydrogenase large subunit
MALNNYPVGSAVTNEVDPISRIEGHLGIAVTVNGSGNITDAYAHGNLWRGFENFLLGREINDAITFVQRICGVCPVPHGLTSTFAVDNVLGYSDGHITFKTAGAKGIPPKALLIRNIVLGAEFLMSSITHFYHLAAPSYVQGPNIAPWTPYFADSYYHPALLSSASGRAGAGATIAPTAAAADIKVWDAVIISYVRALRIRRLTFEAGALFAGRMPMTSCFVGGGVTTDGTEDLSARCAKFKQIMTEVGLFIVNEYVPIALVLGMLYPGFDSNTPTVDGSGNVTGSTMKAGNRGFGAGAGTFLAWGGFPNLDDSLTLPGGVYDSNVADPAGFPTSGGSTTGNDDATHFRAINKAEVASKFLTGGAYSVPANLTEDIAHSRYAKATVDNGAYTGTTAYPGNITRTKPARDNGYSYIKAPRWAGKACEVGPLARLAVAGIYPVKGTTLTTIPGYLAIYTNAGALDARVIAPTIVNALSNMNLVDDVQAWIVGLKGGISTMDRLRARAIESLVLVQALIGSVSKAADGTLSFGNNGWIDQLDAITDNTVGSTWSNKNIPVGTFHGWGGTEAPRGALMHQATIKDGKITAYQCIVPTTWNASPTDTAGNHGPMELSVIGAPFAGTNCPTGIAGNVTSVGGVEVLRIAQSFDPCIACAIH